MHRGRRRGQLVQEGGQVLRDAQTICKQALDGFATFGDLGAYLQNKEKQPSTGTGVALGQMATIIPTMLWGGDYQDANYQLWMQAAALVTWMIIEWAAVKAIPILGQVFGALAFLGDLVQIATSVVEMCMSPWVFDCKVQILYDATITLQKDDKDSTFPKGAGGAKYTVTMVTDGTDQTRSVTGTIADDRADPITLTFPDVPISRTVQYVLHIYDSNGSLIGKGSSAALPNNDTTKLPRAVTLVTEEQMKPITSKTTFVRQDTLQYDPALAKYHWASGVGVAATRTTTDPGPARARPGEHRHGQRHAGGGLAGHQEPVLGAQQPVRGAAGRRHEDGPRRPPAARRGPSRASRT